MRVSVISGTPRPEGRTLRMMRFVEERARAAGGEVGFVDLSAGGIDRFSGAAPGEGTRRAVAGMTAADVWLVGTPVYNSFFSSALKNLFEFVDYKAVGGKVAGLAVLGSGEVSFVQVQNLLTQMMSYFGIAANPKAAFLTAGDIGAGGEVAGEEARGRLSAMVDSTLAMASGIRG